MNDTRKRPWVDRRPPAPHNNIPQLIVGAIATATALVVMALFFWLMASSDSNRSAAPPPADIEFPVEPEPAPEPAPEPPPAPDPGAAPAAPASSRLSSDEWLLSPYAILRQDDKLLVAGTLLNRARTPRSAVVRVYVYADGAPVGVGTAEVRDVPAGGTVELNMPSGSPWAAGEKILLVETEDLA